MADFVAFASADDARLVLDTARRIKASGLLNRIGGSVEDRPLEQPIYWRNVSGETIPAYACIMLGKLLSDDTRDSFSVGSASFMDPTGASGPIVFNSGTDVEPNQLGTVQPGPVFRCKPDLGQPPLQHNTGFASFAPVIGSYEIARRDGGQFTVAPVEGLGGQSAGQDYTAKAWRQPYGTFIYKNRNPVSGIADIHWSGADQIATGISAVVLDQLDIFGDTVTQGLCELSGGLFTAKQAPCPG